MTDVPLREHIDARLDLLGELAQERDRRYTERFESQERALNIAQKASDNWMANANEWRQAMNDRERDFLPRNVGYIFAALAAISVLLQLIGKLT